GLKAETTPTNDSYRARAESGFAIDDWLIQGRVRAASAQLAEFLKTIYADRLDKRARLGPLMGEAPFAGPAPGATPTSKGNNSPGQTPSAPTFDPMGKVAPMGGKSDVTLNQRATPARGEVPDPSRMTTESGAPSWRSR